MAINPEVAKSAASKADGSEVSPKHRLYVDIFDMDDPTHSQGRKKRTGCIYSDGTIIYGREARHQEHPDVRISARRGERVAWESAHPFRVSFEDRAGTIFLDPPPWNSHRRATGVHSVLSSPARPDVVQEEIALKFTIHMRASENGHDPDPNVEELDPHVIIEP